MKGRGDDAGLVRVYVEPRENLRREHVFEYEDVNKERARERAVQAAMNAEGLRRFRGNPQSLTRVIVGARPLAV
jgi:hypothetical protein